MARKPRIEVAGGIYHVGSKGNRGCHIYEDDSERRVFLNVLELTGRRYGWKVYAYCLMTNHYHLLVQLESEGLSRGMQFLNGSFARTYNRRHGYEGHLFRNRFWSELIESQSHLLETARYVVLNPVRAGLCERAEGWAWSSYRVCAGTTYGPSLVAASDLLGLFGRSPPAARRAYRAFVRGGTTGVRHRDESRTRRRGS